MSWEKCNDERGASECRVRRFGFGVWRSGFGVRSSPFANRASESAPIVVRPWPWFRNTWTWGCSHEGCSRKPRSWRDRTGKIRTEHETLEPTARGKIGFMTAATEGKALCSFGCSTVSLIGVERSCFIVADSLYSSLTTPMGSSQVSAAAPQVIIHSA
jgi:hypothetical protein